MSRPSLERKIYEARGKKRVSPGVYESLRKVLAEIGCFLRREMGISMAEIARRLGAGASAVAMAIRRKNSLWWSIIVTIVSYVPIFPSSVKSSCIHGLTPVPTPNLTRMKTHLEQPRVLLPEKRLQTLTDRCESFF